MACLLLFGLCLRDTDSASFLKLSSLPASLGNPVSSSTCPFPSFVSLPSPQSQTLPLLPTQNPLPSLSAPSPSAIQTVSLSLGVCQDFVTPATDAHVTRRATCRPNQPLPAPTWVMDLSLSSQHTAHRKYRPSAPAGLPQHSWSSCFSENQVHTSSALPGIVFLILGPRLVASPAAPLMGARNGAGDYGHGAGDYGHGAGDCRWSRSC